jgi:lipopolysaccharide transport system ATP-binding protein
MSDIVISVRNVSKCYRVFDSQRSRLLHAVWPKHTKGMQEVWALKDINLEIKRGEAVAIIGRNGGGKSTLLEILTGTLTPTTGVSKVNGRVSALLELGSGFNPEYTGRANVILNGLLLGLSREDILSRFSEIEAFAEIGDAIDRPVKTYSSGMMMRLAFAVQVLCDPDILIIDEALSVGDFFFRQKCFSHIQSMLDKGVTLLFVTHDMNTVANLCERVIFLKKGVLQVDSEPHKAIRAFLAQNDDKTEITVCDNSLSIIQKETPYLFDSIKLLPNELFQWKRKKELVPDNGGLLALSLLDDSDQFVSKIRIGDKVRVRVYFLPDKANKAHLYIQFRNRFNEIICTTGTYYLNLNCSNASTQKILCAEFAFEMRLGGGEYSMVLTLAEPLPPNQVGKIYDVVTAIGPLVIDGQYREERVPFMGPFGLPVCGHLSVLDS